MKYLRTSVLLTVLFSLAINAGDGICQDRQERIEAKKIATKKSINGDKLTRQIAAQPAVIQNMIFARARNWGLRNTIEYGSYLPHNFINGIRKYATVLSTNGTTLAYSFPQGEIEIIDIGQANLNGYENPQTICLHSAKGLYNSLPFTTLSTSGDFNIKTGARNPIALSNDGKRIVVASSKNPLVGGHGATFIEFWNISKNSYQKHELAANKCFKLRFGENLSTIALSSDASQVALGDNQGRILIVDYNAQQPPTGLTTPTELRIPNGNNLPPLTIPNLRFGTNNTLISAAANNIQVWNLENSQLIQEFAHAGVKSISITPDDHTIASGSIDGTIRVWNNRTGDCLCTLQHTGSPLCAIDITPDGQKIVSAGRNGDIHLWNVATQKIITSFNHNHDKRAIYHTDQIKNVQFIPNEKGGCLRFRSIDIQGTVKEWGEVVGTYERSITNDARMTHRRILAAALSTITAAAGYLLNTWWKK